MFYLTSGSSEKNLSFQKIKFRQFCQICILYVPELCEEFYSQKQIFSNLDCIFSQNFSNSGETFQQNRQHAFYVSRGTIYKNIMLTLWNNFRLWARKCRSCGGNFAALLIKPLFCLETGNWKNSFLGNFTFSAFFGRPAVIFCFFRCINRGMVVQTQFHKPRGTYPWRKNLGKNFLSFPDYERLILNIHWSLLGMLSKLVYLFIGALWERLFFSNFPKLFSDFER